MESAFICELLKPRSELLSAVRRLFDSVHERSAGRPGPQQPRMQSDPPPLPARPAGTDVLRAGTPARSVTDAMPLERRVLSLLTPSPTMSDDFGFAAKDRT